MELELSAGAPYPLGATLTEGGVNFAVASENAMRIELVLFDQTGAHVTGVVSLPGQTNGVFHGFLSGKPEDCAVIMVGRNGFYF